MTGLNDESSKRAGLPEHCCKAREKGFASWPVGVVAVALEEGSAPGDAQAHARPLLSSGAALTSHGNPSARSWRRARTVTLSDWLGKAGVHTPSDV
jgi:hypothetical protein